jgi:hypothetical protein
MPKSRVTQLKTKHIGCLVLTQTYQKHNQDSELDIFDLYYEYKQQWKAVNSTHSLITIRDFEAIINSTNKNQLTTQLKINLQETTHVEI